MITLFERMTALEMTVFTLDIILFTILMVMFSLMVVDMIVTVISKVISKLKIKRVSQNNTRIFIPHELKIKSI